jgi:serine/threonine protein kinase
MNDQWDRIGALFDTALAHPPAERAALVAASPEPDEIKAEVLSLLASHDDAGDFLETPASEPPPLAEGTVIGAYRILRVLGAGGMGVVYEAEDTRLHRRVAVKSLSPRLSGEESQRQRLKQEARAAAALAHPGIAMVYALEEVDDQIFIISEYLDGETLRAEIDRGRLPIGVALDTARDVARALCAAHERGIVHRDLKPENIIRTVSGAVKILDFGLAQFSGAARDLRSFTRLTEPGLLAGTPPYMAPEQLLGRETDFRTDQFAFGVLLYELCSGEHPFGGGSLPSTIARILAAEPEPLQRNHEVSPEVAQIIDRCLQKDPVGRYDSTQQLVQALEVASANAAVAVVSPASGALRRRIDEVTRRPPSSSSSLWWWRFHQLSAALAYWAMVWPVWHVHRSFGRAGLFFFFATLAAIVVAGNLRLHLWFSSRVYPENLAAQRADVRRWIGSADVAFATLLIAGGIALPEDRAGWAALFISFGIGTGLAALFIEPATARAAFRGSLD